MARFEPWQTMAEQLRRITWADVSLGDAIRMAAEVTQSGIERFNFSPDFWARALAHDFTPAFTQTTAWVAEGFASLRPGTGWDFVFCDLGDCPELFWMYMYPPGLRQYEERFRALTCAPVFFNLDSMDAWYDEEIGSDLWRSDDIPYVTLTTHHTRELTNELLSWALDAYCPYNHEWLWWIIATRAFRTILADAAHCRRALNGHDRLHLFTGFEELFSYIGTITPEGFIFIPTPSRVHPFRRLFRVIKSTTSNPSTSP